MLKNWCFWTVVLENTLDNPLDCKKIQTVHPKGNQSWIFIGRTDAEAETPILWPPDVNNWLIRKDPDAGKDWRQEKKGMTEDETVGWYYWLSGHEFEQATDGQGSLACCSQSLVLQRVGYKWATELMRINSGVIINVASLNTLALPTVEFFFSLGCNKMLILSSLPSFLSVDSWPIFLLLLPQRALTSTIDSCLFGVN